MRVCQFRHFGTSQPRTSAKWLALGGCIGLGPQRATRSLQACNKIVTISAHSGQSVLHTARRQPEPLPPRSWRLHFKRNGGTLRSCPEIQSSSQKRRLSFAQGITSL